MTTFRSETIDRSVTPQVVTVVESDTATQQVTITVDGEVTEQRPFTPQESAQYADIETRQVSDANTTQMVTESEESVDKLVAVVESLNAITDLTNAEINANPAAVIKDVARELKTVARQVNREARMTSGKTDSTDTGPVTDV